MPESPEPDRHQSADDGLPHPPGEVEHWFLPRYRVRPREFYLLWAAALLTYGVGDTATTTLAMLAQPSLVESNPFVAALQAHGGLAAVLVVKGIVLLVMLAISVRGTRRNDRFTYYWPPAVTALLGAILTAWNLRLLAAVG